MGFEEERRLLRRGDQGAGHHCQVPQAGPRRLQRLLRQHVQHKPSVPREQGGLERGVPGGGHIPGDHICHIYITTLPIYHIYQGISVEVVESVLYYIYNGGLKSEVLTTQIQSVPDIYRLADLWQMEELTKLCAKIMVTNVDETSFLELLTFSKVHLQNKRKHRKKKYKE